MNRHFRRVLVADNDTKSRKELSLHLQDGGYYVIPASCASDVLLECEIDPPDAIIMDVRLPDMDGYDVCAQLRHAPECSDVTIILMTEAADSMSRAYLAKMVDFAGGDYFVAKPCDVNLLMKLMEDVLEPVGRGEDQHATTSPTHVVWPTTRPRSYMSAR